MIRTLLPALVIIMGFGLFVPVAQADIVIEYNRGDKKIYNGNAEQYRQRKKHLENRTERLEKQVKKLNRQDKTKAGVRTRRVDRDYIKELEEIAETGDVDLWESIRKDYNAARKEALKKDAAKATKRQEEKEKNPFYNYRGRSKAEDSSSE